MKQTALTATLSVLLFAATGQVRGDIIINFHDVPIPGGTDSAPFFTYTSQGFTLVATNAAGGLTGFEAHGPNSIFWEGEIGVNAFAPATSPPDNTITLTQNNGKPFTLKSIDLARNFPFDPAPTVTFTGDLVGGGTVTESFTVTTPAGTRAFQTFDFTGFTNVTSVSWGQPQLSEGLHQFTNIDILTIPEPASLALAGIGLAVGTGYVLRRRLSHR
jgi:PEP-CTERM motif